MEPFRFHVYVCDQKKPEGAPSCTARGSDYRAFFGGAGLVEIDRIRLPGPANLVIGRKRAG